MLGSNHILGGCCQVVRTVLQMRTQCTAVKWCVIMPLLIWEWAMINCQDQLKETEAKEKWSPRHHYQSCISMLKPYLHIKYQDPGKNNLPPVKEESVK